MCVAPWYFQHTSQFLRLPSHATNAKSFIYCIYADLPSKSFICRIYAKRPGGTPSFRSSSRRRPPLSFLRGVQWQTQLQERGEVTA